jgi:hypothetical protein
MRQERTQHIRRDQEWMNESVGNNENVNDFGTTVI